MKFKFLLFPAVAAFLFSCRSVPTDITYFQGAAVSAQRYTADSPYEPVIKANDQLVITVSSPVLDQTQVAQFNLPVNVFLAPGETRISQSTAVQTYTVNKDGYIQFPVIGKLKLEGLTRSEAIRLIGQKVSDYLPDPIVNLSIVSFKVTVLGEVLKPGPVEVRDERITIFDALGFVGDMTIYGDRKNVTIVRDNNGVKETHSLDLTKTDVFNSPYYYLQQNDVVYVEPNATRKRESKYGSSENYTISIVSIAISATSLIATLFTLFKK